ncbi:helix-turn-helix domain-containing protein [Nocardiopsis dassonvillei]|uniref:helix-turn-helix domain-containing protein n=1 Tax=Nocardiopsis dassonvillei TaxID=2014 RepID=UPI00362DB477
MRKQKRWSQEQLAEEAGLSVTTIKKAENPGRRGEITTGTLHAIATALGVTTTELYTDRAPIGTSSDSEDDQVLARLRAAISPPVGIDGSPLLPEVVSDGPVDLAELHATASRLEVLYRADRYDDVAAALPALVGAGHRAVAELDSDDAYRARAVALQMAGRYLTQTRQIADALDALRASIRDAAQAGDRTLAAIGISGQGWALTRQGRLDEAERLSVLTADAMEPRSLRKATPKELAAWGHLLFRGASAAVRNNGHARARELLSVAGSAASALRKETDCWATFGPLTVAQKEAEFSLIEGKPDKTLALAERLPRVQDVGDVTPINWERHRLDVAEALVLTRDPEQATHVLSGVLQRSPEWLKRQASARRTVHTILGARRTPTAEMVALATHMGVAA